MKKLLPLLAVLLALAAVIAFTWRRTGGLGEKFPATRAAELAPPNAIAFLQFPDLERTRAAWEKTPLGALARDPAWEGTSGGKTLALVFWRVMGNSHLAELSQDILGNETMQPAGFFLAVTEIWKDSAALPKLVGGLPLRAKKTEVEAAVRAMKARLFASWPGAKSELSSHHGIEIETIASPSPLISTVETGASIYLYSRPGAMRVSEKILATPPVRTLGPGDELEKDVPELPLPQVSPRILPSSEKASDQALEKARSAGQSPPASSSPAGTEAPAVHGPDADDASVLVTPAERPILLNEERVIVPAPRAGGGPVGAPLPSVYLAFRDDWFFFATDRALLEGVLNRYLHLPEAGPSLAQETDFTQCQQHGLRAADAIAWARWEPIGKTVAARFGAFIPPQGNPARNPVRAVHYSGVLTGPQARDRVYFHLAHLMVVEPVAACPPPAPVLPGAQAYGAIQLAALRGSGDWRTALLWNGPPWGRRLMQWKEAEFEEWRAAFGPELNFALRSRGDSNPADVAAVLEVRDAAKARVLAEQVDRLYNPPTVEDGGTWWSRWADTELFYSNVVLTKSHLVFATSRSAAHDVVKWLEVGEPALQVAGATLRTPAAENAPNGAIFHFDAPQYFERSFGRLSRAVVEGGGADGWEISIGAAATFSDLPRKLWTIYEEQKSAAKQTSSPPAEPWENFIHPGTVTLRTAGSGWELDTTLGLVGNAILLLWLREG